MGWDGIGFGFELGLGLVLVFGFGFGFRFGLGLGLGFAVWLGMRITEGEESTSMSRSADAPSAANTRSRKVSSPLGPTSTEDTSTLNCREKGRGGLPYLGGGAFLPAGKRKVGAALSGREGSLSYLHKRLICVCEGTNHVNDVEA